MQWCLVRASDISMLSSPPMRARLRGSRYKLPPSMSIATIFVLFLGWGSRERILHRNLGQSGKASIRKGHGPTSVTPLILPALNRLRGGGYPFSRPSTVTPPSPSKRSNSSGSSPSDLPFLPVVKCRLADTVRVFELRKRSLGHLRRAVAVAFDLNGRSSREPMFSLTFVDPDGDSIALKSDQDLTLAIRLAISRSPPPPLRIIVTPSAGTTWKAGPGARLRAVLRASSYACGQQVPQHAPSRVCVSSVVIPDGVEGRGEFAGLCLWITHGEESTSAVVEGATTEMLRSLLPNTPIHIHTYQGLSPFVDSDAFTYSSTLNVTSGGSGISLAELRVAMGDSDKDLESGSCLLCREYLLDTSNVITRKFCGHAFHSRCAALWFSVSDLCPSCPPTSHIHSSSLLTSPTHLPELAPLGHCPPGERECSKFDYNSLSLPRSSSLGHLSPHYKSAGHLSTCPQWAFGSAGIRLYLRFESLNVLVLHILCIFVFLFLLMCLDE
ncbi:hypothetical protein AAMO2058_001312500 [Amorphochlora amoebiformis]